ncbi:uncharacterized protein LOC142219630 [Haematobia irritans]|uniref:uncharacterized protein LOC142219630 n=1 Tax=Haematobia irritans TaxID=7368 RepID=UPI003F4F415E
MDYSQKYRKAWEADPFLKKWVKPTNDDKKALCFYCKCEINARYSDLVRHGKTDKHQRTEKSITNHGLKQPTISFATTPNEMQRSQAKLALYTAIHISFNSIDHLSAICNKEFNDSKAANFSMHRTKCSNIINNVLAPHFIGTLLADLNESKFSLILDEGMKVAHHFVIRVLTQFF